MYQVHAHDQPEHSPLTHDLIHKFYSYVCNAEELSRIGQYLVMNTNFFKRKYFTYLTMIDFPQLSRTREQRIAEAEAAWMKEAN